MRDELIIGTHGQGMNNFVKQVDSGFKKLSMAEIKVLTRGKYYLNSIYF